MGAVDQQLDTKGNAETTNPSTSRRTRKGRGTKAIFPFLSLPLEIRQMIYPRALSYDYILVHKPRAYRVANLLLSCHQILDETQSLFYSLNAFEIQVDGLPPTPNKTSSNKDAVPQHVSDANATPTTLFPNLNLMRQISLHLTATPQFKRTLLASRLRAFLEQIWAGRVEVLLIEIMQYRNADLGISFLTEFSWLREIHLAQIAVFTVKQPGVKGWKELKRQTHYSQNLEREMMKRGWELRDRSQEDEYVCSPRIGIELVGEELEVAKMKGGWVLGKGDLFELFGKKVPKVETGD